jgi:DNA-binding NtrC family response regulator
MEDLPALAAMFVARFAAEAGKRIQGISPAALDLLMSYQWPGNVRQLENALFRAVVLAESALLESVDFPQIVAHANGRDYASRAIATVPIPLVPVHIDSTPARQRPEVKLPVVRDRFLAESGEIAALADIERAAIVFAIEHHGGRMSKVARALRIGRSTLYRKLHEYGLAEELINDAA